MLTTTLENLGGLTQGSYVRVTDGHKTYTLDVLEVRRRELALMPRRSPGEVSAKWAWRLGEVGARL